MKKIILSFVAMVGFLAVVNSANAQAGCFRTEIDAVTLAETQVAFNCGNGNPNTVVNGWGKTNDESIRIRPGGFAIDEAGEKHLCPVWITGGCVDISGTDHYRKGMIKIAKELQRLGVLHGFPRFAYWVNK